MQIGLTISDFGGKKPGELLALVRRFNVAFVEFNPTVFGDLPAVLENVNGMAAGFHLPLVSEHGYDFSSLNDKDRIDETIHLINQHRHELNLLYCVAHPPEAASEDELTDDHLDFLLENLQRLDVPVILENIETWSQSDFDRLLEMYGKLLKKKLIDLCFDPAHAYLRGENIFERFSNIAPRVRCIHLSDCKQGRDAHLPLGEGDLPVAEFLQHVAKSHYDGIINLEVMPSSLEQVGAVVKSYLQVLRVFKKTKYVATKAKLALGGVQFANL